MRFPRVGVAWLLAGLAPAQSLASLIEQAEALGARTGVVIADADGTVLFRHRAFEGFTPASNQKILTALALLDGLGADFHFATRFLLRDGALVVEASGDPNWHTGTEHDAATVFAAVAAGLREAGIDRVRAVRLDAGEFRGPARPPGWPADQLHFDYCAPTSPFLLDEGMFTVRIAPGADGPVAELVVPATGTPIVNELRRVSGRQRSTYGARDEGTRVVVYGRVAPRGAATEFRGVMADPARWYERLLLRELQDGGVRIDRAAPAPADRLVYEHRSPLRPAIERILEDSSNVDAEQCVRVLGAVRNGDGSLAGGLSALRARLESRLGAWPSAVDLHDASGLSAANRLTPGVLVAAMLAMGAGARDATFRECLPVAGRSGTLAERFVDSPLLGRVHAKTGWISGASALTGVVDRDAGDYRYFAILMNYDPQRGGLNGKLKALQERIVAAAAALESER